MLWSRSGGVKTLLLLWTVSDVVSALLCIPPHVFFGVALPSWQAISAPLKLLPWLLPQHSAATKSRCQLK